MAKLFKWLSTPTLLVAQITFWAIVNLILIGRASSLDPGGWASWVQAFGSVIAIFAAGKIASNQASSQYKDARRLQRADRAEQALATARAMAGIAKHVAEHVDTVVIAIANDPEKLRKIVARETHFEQHILFEISADLEAIPTHALLSAPLVKELTLMRPLARRVSEDAKVAMNPLVPGNQPIEFHTLVRGIEDAQWKLHQHVSRIQKVVEDLEVEIKSYTE